MTVQGGQQGQQSSQPAQKSCREGPGRAGAGAPRKARVYRRCQEQDCVGGLGCLAEIAHPQTVRLICLSLYLSVPLTSALCVQPPVLQAARDVFQGEVQPRQTPDIYRVGKGAGPFLLRCPPTSIIISYTSVALEKHLSALLAISISLAIELGKEADQRDVEAARRHRGVHLCAARTCPHDPPSA